MQGLFRFLSPTILGLFMIFSFSARATPLQEPEGAKQVRMALAEAFLRGDLKAIRTRVNDGWSGLRFYKEGEAQPELARAVREAEVISVDKYLVRYKVLTFNRERQVTMSRDGSTEWTLDFNELAGPFPHV